MRSIFPILAGGNIRKSIAYLTDIYQQNQSTDENYVLFAKFTKILKRIATSPLIGSIIMSIVIAISAILIYLLSASTKLALLLPMYLPGTALTTTIGYSINVSYQMFAIYTAILTYTYHDVLAMFQLFHTILLTNILRSKIRAVSNMTIAGTVDLNMRNILMIHMDILRYGFLSIPN